MRVFFFILLSFPLALAAENYRAREVGGGVEVETPAGEKLLLGDPDLVNGNAYAIEVPLSDLKNKQPKASRAPASLLPTELDGATAKDGTSTATDTKVSVDITTDQKVSPSPLVSPTPLEEIAAATPSPTPVPEKEDDSDIVFSLIEANRLYNRGKHYESLSIVYEVTRRRPNYVRGWLMKGSLLYVMGEKELARKAWSRAQALVPSDLDLKATLERYQ